MSLFSFSSGSSAAVPPVQAVAGRSGMEPADAGREEEARLIEAARGGDLASFEKLVQRHSRRVFSYLVQMTRQHQDAEDLAQQTFVKAWHNLHRCDPQRPIIAWLLTIARRSALNHFRAARPWDELPENAASSQPSPAHLLEHGEQLDGVWSLARRVLSERSFEVLWLRYGEERSIEETADIVGLTKTHVKVLVHRARLQLLQAANPS